MVLVGYFCPVVSALHPVARSPPLFSLVERRQEALQCLAQLRGGSESEEAAEEAAYRGWHALYARFRQLATALAVGLDRLWAGRLPEALLLLAGACALNEALQGGPPPAGPKARHLGLDPRLLDHCRRLALLVGASHLARRATGRNSVGWGVAL